MTRPAWLSALRHLALAAIVLWSALPIALIVMFAVKPAREMFDWPPRLPFRPTLDNFVGLWRRWPDFFDNLVNSIAVTGFATLLTVVVATLAGFAYSRARAPLFTASAFFMLFVRLLPPIVITLPLFPLVNTLGLQDGWLVLILLYATFYVSLGTWVMKAFIDQIPRELDEAARVDGAGTAQTLARIIVPLSAQGMVAAGVFVAVYAWNDFLFAFIFTTTRAKTAPVVISEMIGAIDGVDWGVLFAAATVQLAPVLAAVLLAQRYLIAGLTAGSLKG